MPIDQKLTYKQKVEQDLRHELPAYMEGKGSLLKQTGYKAFNIQIPEFSLEAILTGSSKVTAQNIVDLFNVAMTEGQTRRSYAGIVTIRHMRIESGISGL